MNPKEIVLRYESLRGERKNWDYQAEIIERFIAPGRGRFFQEGFDSEPSINWRHRELFDQTAPKLAVLLGANVQSGLMNPGTQWFMPRISEEESNELPEVGEWLEECGHRMARSLNGSNLATEANELMVDLVSFGTGIQLHEELGENTKLAAFGGHHFTTPFAREIYFEEDWNGNLMGVYRRRQYTALQLQDKFGAEALPENIRQMLGTERAIEKHDVVYACVPRVPNWKDIDVSRYLAPKARPWEARYVMYETKEQIGPTYGYHEVPAYVVRWARTAGSKFGHSPGLIALSDVLSLNQLRQVLHDATEKVTDPPLRTTQRGIIGDLQTFASGLTVTRTDSAVEPLVDPRFYRVEVGFEDMRGLIANIESAFYTDQLQLKESPTMTATEVRARMELMMRFLGPVIGRLKSDYLDPLISRTFWMMARKGALPPPPPSLEDVEDYEIEYLGPLARASRLQDVEAIERMVVSAASMAEAAGPQVFDRIDFDQAVEHTADVLGVPKKVVRDDGEVTRLRNGRAAEERQAQAVEQAGAVAKAAADAAKADNLLASTPGIGGIM